MTRIRYRKPHRYKKKKPLLKQRFFWLAVLIVLTLSSFFYFIFFSKIFQVTKIIISGQEKVAKGDIESLAGQNLENSILFFKTKSIFTVDLGRIKKDILARYPQIAKAEVSRGFFDAIKIGISERQASAVWCGQSCFLLDGEGIIFEEGTGIAHSIASNKTIASSCLLISPKTILSGLILNELTIKSSIEISPFPSTLGSLVTMGIQCRYLGNLISGVSSTLIIL